MDGIGGMMIIYWHYVLKGAEVLYTRVLRPYLLNAQSDIDKHAEQLRQKVSDVASDLTKKD